MKKLIDEKGRLFHRLNVLDLLLIVILVVAMVAAIWKFVPIGKHNLSPQYTSGTITFRFSSLSEYQVEALKKGDELSILRVQKFGKIIDIKVAPRYDLVNSADGTAYNVESPSFYTAVVTVRNEQCYQNEKGFFIDRNYQIWKNQGFGLTNGLISAEAMVIDMALEDAGTK